MEAIKIGNNITVYIAGRMYKKTIPNPDLADDIYMTLVDNPNMDYEEFQETILPYFNDNLRIGMKCGLETDLNTGNVYLKGFNTPMPKDLVEIFEEYYEKDYPLEAVENFWKLLMLNPIKKVREDAFKFIKTHDFVITKNGYLIVYKGVDIYDGHSMTKDLLAFVSNKYLHVKKVWKENPAKYVVYEKDGEYKITKEKTAANFSESTNVVGNLKTLFNDIENGNYAEITDDDKTTTYTDYYTHTFRIKIGKPVNQSETECDPNPNLSCSFGLHVGATSYVETFVQPNGAVLVCYVNPAKIIAVPESQHSKMRVSEYFPFALATYENGKIDIIEEEYFESDYAEYEKENLNNLLEKLKKEENLNVVVGKNVVSEELQVAEDRPTEELQKIIENRIVSLV